MSDVMWRPELGSALILTSWLAACAAGDRGVVASNQAVVPGLMDAGVAAANASGTPGGGDANASYLHDAATTIVDAWVDVPDSSLANCATGKAKAAVASAAEPADIIFAIDSSGSMDDEIAFVQAQMNRFSQQIGASGIDARVILIGEEDATCIGAPLGSGRCPEDTKLPGYLHVARTVGSNNGLNVILDSYPEWSSQLRTNAVKSFVIVTDMCWFMFPHFAATDGPNDSAAEFIRNLERLDAAMFAKWTFNGIFVQQDCPLGERIGQVYTDLVARTQGVSGDLCLQDFQPVFDRLSQKIVASSTVVIACDWDIPAPPSGETLDLESVNIRYVDGNGAAASLGKVPVGADCPKFVNGWYYDDEQSPNFILACPQSCAQMRRSGVSEVEVLLGCKSMPPQPLL
jgi:hypothetical protein